MCSTLYKMNLTATNSNAKQALLCSRTTEREREKREGEEGGEEGVSNRGMY